MKHTLGTLCILALASFVVGGCGGGKAIPADVFPNAPKTFTPTSGPDSFLLFPNPQKQDDGTLQIATQSYATAYYVAIDPGNERDTLAKFKAKNGFGTAAGALGEETVIVGDQRDLGYGRKLTARQNPDGSLAFMVENYLVGAYGAYSSLNLDAAVVSEAKWHLGTNGIEFSPGPGGSINFVKFYTFNPVTGARLLMANLDGRGDKAMPTVCASCHGGRADPLTPTGLFARLMNAKSAVDTVAPALGGLRGDMGAQLHPLEPASFDFSATPAFTRLMQESKIKTINKMILCSFPIPGGPVGGTDDACRRTAINDEYQGTVATHLKDMYGGAVNNLQNATTNTTDTYVPAGWAGQSSLYLNTQATSCRVCHLLRGTGNQNDIDFDSYAKFDGYSARIKTHILDRGNMPLAKLIYDKFWATPTIYGPMATYLTGKGYTNTSTQPGGPIPDPGPDRLVKKTSITLSSAMSLYSSSYLWAIDAGSPTGGALLKNTPTSATGTTATTASPTFVAPGSGTYWVNLTTSSASATSATVKLIIAVDTTLATDPDDLRFADIKALLQGAPGFCSGCHTNGGGPPIWYTNFDRNADGATNATDDQWFYTELRGRINFTDIAASPLLRKPTGNHHGGGTVLNITGLAPGDAAAARVAYDKILGWILNGAPE